MTNENCSWNLAILGIDVNSEQWTSYPELTKQTELAGVCWRDWMGGAHEPIHNITAHLALQNIAITEAELRSLIIRSLPKSMSVISTVVTAIPTMTMDAIDALVGVEIVREKNPNNQKMNTKTQPSANTAQCIQHNSNRNNRYGNFSNSNNLNPNNPIRKKGLCHVCGKPCHFNRVPRKKIADDKRRQNNSGNQRTNYQGSKTWHDQNQNHKSNNSAKNNWDGNNQNIINSDVQSLISALKSSIKSNSSNNDNQFGGFMGQAKFRSNIAELSETKNLTLK